MTDISHGPHPVKTFAFDHYGQYLLTAAGEKLKAFYYRDFSTPLAVLDCSASELVIDESAERIVAVEGSN